MPSNRGEIIAEIEQHIQKFGGSLSEWCVGTAKDPRGPFFQNHLVADLNDGLIYREAFTLSAAQAIRDHLRTGNREQVTGNSRTVTSEERKDREQVTGNRNGKCREQGTGNREQKNNYEK